MGRPRILIVEDDVKTSGTLRLYLEDAGYAVSVVADGAAALDEARSGGHDLMILDLMLPRVGGLDVCRAVRRASDLPIIMLTARTTEQDRVRGLDLGADDYVAKPFSPRELLSRVRAVLRRAGHPEENGGVLRCGDLCVDLRRHEVRRGERRIALTPAEFKLLEVLARSPGRVFTREELRNRAFEDAGALDRTIDAHIKNLRRKIENEPSRPSRIVTVFGVGYRLESDRDAA